MEQFQVVERGARPLEEKLEGVGQEESAAPLPPTLKKVLHYWLLLKGNPLFSYGPALCLTPLRNNGQHSVEECLCLFFSMCIRILVLV